MTNETKSDARHTLLLIADGITNDQPITISRPDLTGVSRMRRGETEHYAVPGSSFRGTLRRRAMEAFMDRFPDQKFDFNTMAMNIVGGVKGSGESLRPAVETVQSWRERNPLIDLMGCGDPIFLPGTLYVGNMWSTSPYDRSKRNVDSGVRRDFIQDAPEYFDKMSPEGRALYEIMRATVGERGPFKDAMEQAKTINADRKATPEQKAEKIALVLETLSRRTGREFTDIAQVQAAVTEFKETLSGNGLSDVALQLPLRGAESIPAGLTFNQRIHLDNSGTLAIGLFIEALRRFGRTPFIGGRRANGQGGGDLSLRYTVQRLEQQGYVPDSTITISAFGELEITPANGHSVIQACDQAWRNADPADLEIEYPAFAKEASAPKKGKKAAAEEVA